MLAFSINGLSPTCATLLLITMVFSGSLSLASLASLLLPDASRPFLYACCALLSLGYLLSLVTRRCQRVRQRLMGGSPPPLLRVDTRGSNPRNSVTFFAVVGLNSRVNATTGPYIAASDSSGLDIQIVKTVFFRRRRRPVHLV